MNTKLMQLLSFFNLLDRSQKLSITNLAVFVLIAKIAVAPFDWPTAATLMITLLNYAHKRTTSAKAEQEATNVSQAVVEAANEVQTKVEQLESTVSALALKAGLKR